MLEKYTFPDLDVRYRGKPLDEGPLPTLLYFALSSASSLAEDPFNQPAVFFLQKHQGQARVFSVTLPMHEEGKSPQLALSAWSEAFQKGLDPLAPFLSHVVNLCNQLLIEHIIEEKSFAIGGLSRGAFMGIHIIAKLAWAKRIVCFAPLIDLFKAKEFAPFDDRKVHSYSCLNLAHNLFDKSIFITIGNKDDRVSTRRSFDFIEKVAETAYQNRIRSPDVHLRIYPSIGHQGHGTPPHIFQAGITWL